MAERRMFAKTIIDSDAFIDMPASARLLYYDLSMRADDDGFVNSPKKIARMTGASIDDMNILALKKFIIPFESGIVVIKHWKIHNYIRKDMYKPTKYIDEKSTLYLDENNAYKQVSYEPVTEPLQLRNESATNPSTQDRLGKDRLGKENINNNNNNAPAQNSIFNIFENELARPLSPMEMDTILGWQIDHSDDLIREALNRAVLNDKRNFAYIRGILNDWLSNNIKTLDDVRKRDKERDQKKGSTKNARDTKTDNQFEGFNFGTVL